MIFALQGAASEAHNANNPVEIPVGLRTKESAIVLRRDFSGAAGQEVKVPVRRASARTQVGVPMQLTSSVMWLQERRRSEVSAEKGHLTGNPS